MTTQRPFFNLTQLVSLMIPATLMTKGTQRAAPLVALSHHRPWPRTHRPPWPTHCSPSSLPTCLLWTLHPVLLSNLPSVDLIHLIYPLLRNTTPTVGTILIPSPSHGALPPNHPQRRDSLPLHQSTPKTTALSTTCPRLQICY